MPEMDVGFGAERRDMVEDTVLPDMTDTEIEALVFLVAHDAPVPADHVGLFLCDGYIGDHQRNAGLGMDHMASLLRQGAACMPSRRHYAPTEKGRIAAALLLFSRPDMTEAFFDLLG